MAGPTGSEERTPYLRSLARTTRYLLTLLLIAASVIASGLGIWLLESNSGQILLAYALLIQGCAALVFLPKNAALAGPRPPRIHLQILCVICSLALLSSAYRLVAYNTSGNWPIFLALWFGGVLCFVSAFHLSDIANREQPSTISAFDLWFCIAVFLVSLACRAWMISTRSPVAIEDELQVFAGSLSQTRWPAISPLLTLNSFPTLYYWLVAFLYPFFRPFVDLYTFGKLGAATAGSLSIAAWFLVVRIYSSRIIAVYTSLFLCFLGWHWLNSRFLYAYPYDLAFIGTATLFIVTGIERQSYLLAAIAGVVSSLTLVFQKIGIAIFPFIAYVLVDYHLCRSGEARKRILPIGLVWLGTALVTYSPFILNAALGSYRGEGWLPRHTLILSHRQGELSRLGLSQFDALVGMYIDLFYQLQIREFDSLRHIFRFHGSILDPLSSGLFMLGLLRAIKEGRHERWARLCVVGLLIFVLPMALSFPIDGGSRHGVARRSLGTVFFVAWLCAGGAELLGQRVLPLSFRRIGVLGVCGIACFLNVYFLFSSYIPAFPQPGIGSHKDLGIQRGGTVQVVRSLAASGYPTLYL
jgi:hypothetical protein